MGKWRWKVGVGESAVDGISITGGRQLVLACLVPPDVEPPMVPYRCGVRADTWRIIARRLADQRAVEGVPAAPARGPLPARSSCQPRAPASASREAAGRGELAWPAGRVDVGPDSGGGFLDGVGRPCGARRSIDIPCSGCTLPVRPSSPSGCVAVAAAIEKGPTLPSGQTGHNRPTAPSCRRRRVSLF